MTQHSTNTYGLIVFLIAIILLLNISACTEKSNTQEQYQLPSLNVMENNDYSNKDLNSNLSITWGFDRHPAANELGVFPYGFAGNIGVTDVNKNMYQNMVNYINQKYNIGFEGESYKPIYSNILEERVYDSSMAQKIKNPKLYDVYLTNPYYAMREGEIRTIPKDMIMAYAPDYANILSAVDGWRFNVHENGEYMGISTYDGNYDQLSRFSLYRLDWLEEEGIKPPGDLIELDERVFFSAASFSQDEYWRIVQMFTKNNITKSAAPAYNWIDLPLGQKWGVAVNYLNITSSIIPIMGMYGIDSEVVEDMGRAVPYYASTQFKSVLNAIYDAAKNGSVLVYGFSENSEVSHVSAFSETGDSLGWASINLYDINHVCGLLLSREPEAEILITPPEIGVSGAQSAGVFQPASAFTPERSWVAGAHVTDDRLIQILRLINDFSFNKELFIAANYGTAGEQFEWEGEPYSSAIIPHYSAIKKYGRRNFIEIESPVSAAQEYFNVNRHLSDYAGSPTGRGMSGTPYREEVWGQYPQDKAMLDFEYKDAIENILRENLKRILWPPGQEDLDFEMFWNEYMAQLSENGLERYIMFYNQTQ